MDPREEAGGEPIRGTAVERRSDRELTVTRVIAGPVRSVFEAFTDAARFGRWWVPSSCGLVLLSCDMDVRVGGQYRLVFRVGEDQQMAAFGTYAEVTPHSRLCWTNDETPDGPLTTVIFEALGDRTHLVMHELFPTSAALDAVIESGEKSTLGETFDQLDALLAAEARPLAT